MTDIIERLQDGEPGSIWDAAREIKALRAENARLRAVIKFILDNVQSERRSNDIDSVIVHGETIRAARAAMGESDG